MLYQLAHIIQQHCHILWTCIEHVNTALFLLRYGQRLKSLQTMQIEGVELAQKKHADALTQFFANQDEASFIYFKPHGFDSETIRQLLKRRSMIMWVSLDEEQQITGYAFLRCFWIGKGYRGYIVDKNHRGKGIGNQLGAALNATQQELGLHTYKSISPSNTASLALAKRTCQLIPIETTSNGDTCYQCVLQ